MPAKKVNDRDIIALNSVGISLASIARRLDCHHTTVTARLHRLNIAPADTRRAFTEEIYDDLTSTQQDWLVNKLGPATSIKDFIKSLIINDYVKDKA